MPSQERAPVSLPCRKTQKNLPYTATATAASIWMLSLIHIYGVTADDANQEWWCFTKGGEMLETGVDSTPIADSDTFEITLTQGY